MSIDLLVYFIKSFDWYFDVVQGAKFNLFWIQISLIEAAGYPAETHIVTTEDGYILQLHRIPYSKNDLNVTAIRPIVFIQHGLMGTDEKYVLSWSKPTESLGEFQFLNIKFRQCNVNIINNQVNFWLPFYSYFYRVFVVWCWIWCLAWKLSWELL